MRTQEFLNEICENLGRSPDTLTLTDTPQTVPEWDSIGHLTIISTTEQALGADIADPVLQMFGSLGDLVARLKARQLLGD